MSTIRPTQVAHPWRASARTLVAATIGLLPLLPEITLTAGIDTVPAVAQTLAVTTAVTRVLALPRVNDWLQRYRLTGWLAAEPLLDASAITDPALGSGVAGHAPEGGD